MKPETRREFSRGFQREFVEKVVVAAMASATARERPGSAIRILELEHDIEDLKRQIGHQAVTIQILEKKTRL